MQGITDENMLNKIVDEVFDQIDYNGDGAINLKEFIHEYVETRNKLLEKQEEVMRNIVDHHRAEEEVKFKLKEA